MTTNVQSWKAGVATAVITPAEPMWLAGFARRTRPAEGKATDLFAKALALEDVNGNRLIILTADLIAMPREIAEHIASECKKNFGLGRQQLLLTTSHTHSGPEIRPSKTFFFNIPDEYALKIPRYVEHLQNQMMQVISEAIRNLQPATLFAGRGTVDFAHNRRGANQYFDHDVPVLRVTDLSGTTRAIVFGYACHNTTLWEDSYVYCGDYAGFAQQFLQDQFNGATAMFLCGAAADQNPEPRGKIELARQHGAALASAVGAALLSSTEVQPALSVTFEQVPLDFQPIQSREDLEEQSRSTDPPLARKAKFLLAQFSRGQHFDSSYPCPIQVIRFGNSIRLIAMGGEPVAEYAMNFKHEFEEERTMVWTVGYANDMFGYLPTQRVQKEGGYEGGRAMLWSALPMPWILDVEPRIMAATRRMMASTGKQIGGPDIDRRR